MAELRAGVYPEDMDASAVPVAEDDVSSVNSAQAQRNTDAINAAFATGEVVVLSGRRDGAGLKGRGTYVLEGTVHVAGTDSSHENQQRRQVEFKSVGLRARAGAPDEGFAEILGMDRTKGRGFDVDVTKAKPAVIRRSGGKHGLFIGQAFSLHGDVPAGFIRGDPEREGNATANDWNDGSMSADDSTVYYVSAQNFSDTEFRAAKTRRNALAGDNSVGTDAAGTCTLKYGSLVGREANDSFPVPTEPVRVLLDLGNTRYSHYSGNLRLNGGGKPNLALMGTSGLLTMETFAGGGQSVWNGSVNLSNAGYGIYIPSRLDSKENLFLPDTLTGAVFDNITFEPSIDHPMVVGGNSMDGAVIGRLRIAAKAGSLSHVVNTHFSATSMFMHCDDGKTCMFEIEKASIAATECYLEGGDSSPPNGGNFGAFIRQLKSANVDIKLIKCSAGPSKFAIGVVDFVAPNGSCVIGFQENSEESDMQVAIRLTRNGSGDCRLCEVVMPFKEGGRKPYLMTEAGETEDQLLSKSATQGLAQWKPVAGSVDPERLALTV